MHGEATALPLSIRRACPDDALCLGVLGMQVFLDTYATDGIRPAIAQEALASFSTGALAGLLGDAQTQVQVAELHGHLVGFVQLTLGAAHALAPAAAPSELARLYVQQPFTGRGVGSALLRQAERAARAAGSDLLWLTAWVGNQRARRFYPRQGYEERGVTTFTFQGESHENRLFAKALPGEPGITALR